MQAFDELHSVAQVIQQAVAPVFLLTGVGGLLTVVTNRLGRIVDRYRLLDSLESEHEKSRFASEMAVLARRAAWAHRAISLCTVCALLICLVVAILFIGSEFRLDSSTMISMLFIAAMLTLVAGLLCFLREISLATGAIETRGQR